MKSLGLGLENVLFTSLLLYHWAMQSSVLYCVLFFGSFV